MRLTKSNQRRAVDRRTVAGQETDDMKDIAEYNDLCMTCNYAATCVRRKHHNGPVWFCEEFDDYQPPPKESARVSAAADLAEKEEISPHLKGLCCNCGNREICTIPKSEGGIWHCEEYC
jgi:hypothetical protein